MTEQAIWSITVAEVLDSAELTPGRAADLLGVDKTTIYRWLRDGINKRSTAALFESPRHPYTRALLHALPTLETKGRLQTIPGSVPDLSKLPRGCAYQDRCERVQARCRSEEPPLEGGARCFYPYGDS